MNAAARLELVRELVSFEGRWPGTDAERRAANHLAARLRAAGRRAEVEPTHVHPEYPLVHALHLALGIAGSVAAIYTPPIGFALVLVAATSMYGDLTTRFYLLRRLFFRRASQNVVSPGGTDAPARVILCAHYDAAKTGYVFSPKSVERGARMQHSFPFTPGPFFLIFWPLAALLPILGARMAGVDAQWIGVIQLLATLPLMIAVPLLIDISLSAIVPGANDNATGVATVISLAEELDSTPPGSLDVWLLLLGAEETLMEGMRAFVRAHRSELERASTYFINIDTVGIGTVRYTTHEGFVLMYDFDRRLVELCDAIAAADRDGPGHYGAEPLAHRMGTDALPPRVAGYPAISITCLNERGFVPHYHHPSDLPEHLDPEALDRAHDFTLELVRQLDRDVSRQTARSERS